MPDPTVQIPLGATAGRIAAYWLFQMITWTLPWSARIAFWLSRWELEHQLKIVAGSSNGPLTWIAITRAADILDRLHIPHPEVNQGHQSKLWSKC